MLRNTKEKWVLSEKNVDKIKCPEKIANNSDCSLPAHLFLSYHTTGPIGPTVIILYIFFFNHIELFSFNLFLYQIKAAGQFNILILISDGNSDIGAHVWSNICYLICLRHLFRSRAVTIFFFFFRRNIFSFFFAQYDSYLPSI